MKLTTTIPEATAAELTLLAANLRTTRTDALCRAITLTALIEREWRDGGVLLIKRQDGSLQQIVWKETSA